MKNEYQICGEITEITITSKKHGARKTVISTSKLEKVKNFEGRWNLKKEKGTGEFYIIGMKNEVGKRVAIFLHRLVTDAPQGLVVDHINHDTLDNTDGNLRVVSQLANSQNKLKANINSRSGSRGVFWHKGYEKWYVQIQVEGNKKHIGSFSNFDDADKASKEARARYHPFSTEAVELCNLAK